MIFFFTRRGILFLRLHLHFFVSTQRGNGGASIFLVNQSLDLGNTHLTLIFPLRKLHLSFLSNASCTL